MALGQASRPLGYASTPPNLVFNHLDQATRPIGQYTRLLGPLERPPSSRVTLNALHSRLPLGSLYKPLCLTSRSSGQVSKQTFKFFWLLLQTNGSGLQEI